MPNCKTLPGITAIEFIAAEEMILSPKRILSPGIKSGVIGRFTKFNLVGLASCTTTDERTNAGIVYTTKVAGMIHDDTDMDVSRQHLLTEKFHSYRLSDVYKTQYLVGIDKKPFPEIKFSPANDASPTGVRAVNFEITWISTLPPVELFIL